VSITTVRDDGHHIRTDFEQAVQSVHPLLDVTKREPVRHAVVHVPRESVQRHDVIVCQARRGVDLQEALSGGIVILSRKETRSLLASCSRPRVRGERKNSGG
jgi:hypothetical protein